MTALGGTVKKHWDAQEGGHFAGHGDGAMVRFGGGGGGGGHGDGVMVRYGGGRRRAPKRQGRLRPRGGLWRQRLQRQRRRRWRPRLQRQRRRRSLLRAGSGRVRRGGRALGCARARGGGGGGGEQLAARAGTIIVAGHRGPGATRPTLPKQLHGAGGAAADGAGPPRLLHSARMSGFLGRLPAITRRTRLRVFLFARRTRRLDAARRARLPALANATPTLLVGSLAAAGCLHVPARDGEPTLSLLVDSGATVHVAGHGW